MADKKPGIRTVHVRIEGRVQGVYYRAWAKENADQLKLDGWVRNRADGSVEAVFSGAPEAVAEMLKRCWSGPREARVETVRLLQEGGGVPAGFEIRPTA